MRFFRWVIKKYENDDSMKGVLARSFKADKDKFPSYRAISTQRRFMLEYCNPSDECIKAFDECAEEYAREVHRNEVSR
ncbi:MAG: hypothetical protein IJJ74_10510 [Eubacterium sp.]|nr:hypothetical protein [Eubacterium sp.]